VLAVISEYLAAIYDEAKARPRFVVAAVTPPSGSAGSDSSS
jgi:hypothetical protein